MPAPIITTSIWEEMAISNDAPAIVELPEPNNV
jgi:hypothetical protein